MALKDANEDGELTPQEYGGFPAPRVNLIGTDQLGRDLLTRLIYGARISLAVGLIATLVSFLIGVTWGAVSGYVGGRLDNFMMRFVDVMYSLPSIIFVIVLITTLHGADSNVLLLPSTFIAEGCYSSVSLASIRKLNALTVAKALKIRAQEVVDVAPRVTGRHAHSYDLSTVWSDPDQLIGLINNAPLFRKAFGVWHRDKAGVLIHGSGMRQKGR